MTPSEPPSRPSATQESVPCSCLKVQNGCLPRAAAIPHFSDSSSSLASEATKPSLVRRRKCRPHSTGCMPTTARTRSKSVMTKSSVVRRRGGTGAGTAASAGLLAGGVGRSPEQAACMAAAMTIVHADRIVELVTLVIFVGRRRRGVRRAQIATVQQKPMREFESSLQQFAEFLLNTHDRRAVGFLPKSGEVTS